MNILNEHEPVRSQEFLDAFHYAQKGTGRRLQLGKLAFLYRDKKYEESVKVAHHFADYYVDKAIEYRQNYLGAKGRKGTAFDDDMPGQRVVLLHDMAMATDNRKDLRNQILHGISSSVTQYVMSRRVLTSQSVSRRARIKCNYHRKRTFPALPQSKQMG